MNPISHHQIAQSTHKEYEARYGNRARENEGRQETTRSEFRKKEKFGMLTRKLNQLLALGTVAFLFITSLLASGFYQPGDPLLTCNDIARLAEMGLEYLC